MKIKKLSLAAFALGGFFTAVIPVSAQNWTSNAVPNFGWTSVASSADGSKLVAVGNFSAYTSTNSGVTWISNSAPSAEWISVASSADGNKLVAAVGLYNGFIYTSTNAGAAWSVTSAPGTNWVSVASSADGTKLVAAAGNWYNAYIDGIARTVPGLIYISTNSGISWTATSAPCTNWQAVASSADGTKLAAAVTGVIDVNGAGYETDGLIYTSTNAGAIWTAATAPALGWTSIASSADGGKLIAASYIGSQLYRSTDLGAIWTTNSAPENWTCIASSANGDRLVGVANLIEYGGSCQIYTSTNSGTNWIDSDAPNLDFRSVAYSADGTKLVASVYDGAIYTLQTTPTPCLNIALSCTNLALSWIIPSSNFSLQQNSDLTTTNWINVATAPVLNLTNLQNQTTLPFPEGNYFYRLKSQ